MGVVIFVIFVSNDVFSRWDCSLGVLVLCFKEYNNTQYTCMHVCTYCISDRINNERCFMLFNALILYLILGYAAKLLHLLTKLTIHELFFTIYFGTEVDELYHPSHETQPPAQHIDRG